MSVMGSGQSVYIGDGGIMGIYSSIQAGLIWSNDLQ